jgi:hypothetical protein
MTEKAFDYQLEKGAVTQIGSSETKNFLVVGGFPAGKDRTLTQEAIETLGLAYNWSAAVRERDAK